MTMLNITFIGLLAVFGAIVMSLEIVSSGLMAPYFGGSIYIWGSIISSFMVQLALGYVLGGHLAKRTRRISPLLFFLTLGSAWVIAIPQMQHPIGDLVSRAISDVRLGSLVVMTVMFFVPIVFMAMISPFIIGILAVYQPRSWLGAGHVLFFSTLGSFVGTNLTSFYLVDIFPISRIITGLGLLGLGLVLVAYCLQPDRRLRVIDAEIGYTS